MKKKEVKSASDIFFIGIIIAAWIAGTAPLIIPSRQGNTVYIYPAKSTYYHHQFVKIEARLYHSSLKDTLKEQGIPVSVVYENEIITGIGNKKEISLTYIPERDIWEGRWPCPWNSPSGTYTPISVQEDLPYTSKSFTIARKPISKIPRGFSVMIYETNDDFSSLRPPLPGGGRGRWQNIFDWCELTGVDALWVLGGQTAYFTTRLAFDFPWLEHNLPFLSTLAKEAHNRGFGFGAYVMAYLTFGKSELKPQRYEYAINYDLKSDSLFRTRSVSLGDEQRKKDIVEMVTILNDIQEIDYIGLDYIRNALGGYELVDDFVNDMDVTVPEQWHTMRVEDRMKWFARKKIARTDMDLIDQWQWWRAHKAAVLVEEIIDEANLSKPLWVFTLSWELGWQHGQDPVMMSDAGAAIDAVMLYEADNDEYRDLLRHWRTYLKKNHANIIVGDVIDWNLHQKTMNPAGPEEYFIRNTQAIKQIYIDGPSKGVFLHDLNRIFRGRRGPYSRLEWALAGAAAVTMNKEMYNLHPLSVNLSIPEDIKTGRDFTITVNINRRKRITGLVACQLFHSVGLTSYDATEWTETFDKGSEVQREISCNVLFPNKKRYGRHYIAVRAEWLEEGRKKSYSTIRYFSIQGWDKPRADDSADSLTAGSSLQKHIVIQNHRILTEPLSKGTTKTAGED